MTDKYKAQHKWQAENMVKVCFQFRKVDHIPELVIEAVKQGKAPTKQAYITGAILQRLTADGVTLSAQDDGGQLPSKGE